MLRIPTIKVMTHAVLFIGFDGSALAAANSALCTNQWGNNFDQKPSSRQAKAGNDGQPVKKERLPLRRILSWNSTITVPAICLANLGQNTNKGATQFCQEIEPYTDL
jgi:hypothetical protein